MHQICYCSVSTINAFSLQPLSSLADSGKGFLVGEQGVNIQASRRIKHLVQWITLTFSTSVKKPRYKVAAGYSLYGELVRHRGTVSLCEIQAFAAV
jgi:hypothetical protein